MLSRLDIILIVVSVIALLFAVQLIYLRSRDRRLRDIADRLRHGPDDVFLVRMVGALKSPLTMISGPVEHLDASSTLSEEDRKMLDLMKTSVERMDRIVGQLSDYTRKDFKGLRLSLNRDFPVCSQIRSDMEYFRSNADLLGISIKEEGTDSELRIPLDLEKFENIFHNLLYGALKFVFREGEVCVRTGTLSGDEVSGRARIDRGSLEDIYFMLNIPVRLSTRMFSKPFSVRNTCISIPGISPEWGFTLQRPWQMPTKVSCGLRTRPTGTA